MGIETNDRYFREAW